jgi:hypothetical protein
VPGSGVPAEVWPVPLTVIDERRPSPATTTSCAARRPEAEAVNPTSTVHVLLGGSDRPGLHCPDRANSFGCEPSNTSVPIVTVALVMFLNLTRCVVDGVPMPQVPKSIWVRSVVKALADPPDAEPTSLMRYGSGSLTAIDTWLPKSPAVPGRERHLHRALLARHERGAGAAARDLVRRPVEMPAIVIDALPLLLTWNDCWAVVPAVICPKSSTGGIEHSRPALWPAAGRRGSGSRGCRRR